MNLKYGKQLIKFEPPQNINWRILEKENPKSVLAESEIVKLAVQHLIELLDQNNIPKGGNVLIIIPDHTRKCRLEIILPVLINELDHFKARLAFLIANGSHVIQPESVVRDIVGETLYQQYRFMQHDSKDEQSLYYLGDTSFGTSIWLNHKVEQADHIITVGGILYHYFAGFGGGPKMLMPGVAGYETIRQNHRRTLNETTGGFHSDCYEGNISTNPIFIDLAEVMKFLPNVTSFQVVMSPNNKILYAETGPVLETHQTLCEKVKELYSLVIPQKADIVIASSGGFPADVNLIQSHKSIHHAFQAVKGKGWLIVLAECSEGIGSQTFLPYFDAGSSINIARELLKDYKINGHTSLALKTKTEKTNIVFVSKLAPEIVLKTGMTPAQDIEEAWNIVLPNIRPDALGYIMPNASTFVPLLG